MSSPLSVTRGVPRDARPRPLVLAVDDEPCIRVLLAHALPLEGFDVLLAAGGPEALELYWQHRGEVALVLLEVHMPGLDGPEVLAALRALSPALPCCFLSGHTGPYVAEQLLGLGAACVIAKPFILRELAAALRRALSPRTVACVPERAAGHQAVAPHPAF